MSTRRQRGFTMIEMLVVISILGVLAAIVSMSMIGLNETAQRRADDGETMTVQSAMNFMMTDQMVDPETACSTYAGGTGGVTDMAQFPTIAVRPTPDGTGNGASNHQPVQLWPHYLRDRYTRLHYVCTGAGRVTPVRT